MRTVQIVDASNMDNVFLYQLGVVLHETERDKLLRVFLRRLRAYFGLHKAQIVLSSNPSAPFSVLTNSTGEHFSPSISRNFDEEDLMARFTKFPSQNESIFQLDLDEKLDLI